MRHIARAGTRQFLTCPKSPRCCSHFAGSVALSHTLRTRPLIISTACVPHSCVSLIVFASASIFFWEPPLHFHVGSFGAPRCWLCHCWKTESLGIGPTGCFSAGGGYWEETGSVQTRELQGIERPLEQGYRRLQQTCNSEETQDRYPEESFGVQPDPCLISDLWLLTICFCHLASIWYVP